VQNYRNSLSALETELRELQLKSLRDPASTRKQIKIVKDNISDLLQKKFEGAKIRSRAKYLDYGGIAFLLLLTCRKAKRSQVNH